MARDPRLQDWEILGLEQDAGIEAVRQAYARRKALYGNDALATYSLHDDREREALLERLDDAYRTIAESLGGGTQVVTPQPSERGPAVEPPSGPEPPLRERPGDYLRFQRMSNRVRLDELALETKIRASLLELLEAESFRDLPAPVYVRGFIIQSARALKIDHAEELADAYLAKMREALGDGL